MILLSNKKLAVQKRISLFVEQVVVLLVTCGPYVWWRVAVDSQRELIGNWYHLVDPWYFWNRLFSFNPLEILAHPFVKNPLAAAQGSPENFWDVLYKTSLFGEWTFPCRTLAIYLELTGMFLLCYAVGGIAFEFLRRKVNLVAFSTILIQIGGLWLYRIKIGWHCAFVDLRYIPIVILPIAYYIVLGIHKSPMALKIFGVMLAILFLALSLAVFPSILSP